MVSSSLATTSTAVDMDSHSAPPWNALPELPEEEFMRQVVHSSVPNFEEYLDGLIARAANLGISLSRPSTAVATPDKRNTIRTESSATLNNNPTRSASTGSDELANTPITSPSFRDFHLEFPGKMLNRKLSKTPTFAQYEDYLAQIDPHFKRSKPNSLPSLEARRTPSIFSSRTTKSLFGIRHGLSKICPKRKSMHPAGLLLRFAPPPPGRPPGSSALAIIEN